MNYQLWASYSPNNIVEVQDGEEIDDNGQISLARSDSGTCSHIISILSFMGYARYEQNIRYPYTRITDFISDAT